MSDRYAVTGAMTAVTSAYKTMLDLVGSTTARPAIDYFTASAGSLATNSTLADQSVEVQLMRHTTANTGTGVTPTLLDPGGIACVATGLEQCTAEGTYTAGTEMYQQAIHIRSQAYWWASSEAARIVVAAAASNGVGTRIAMASPNSGGYAGSYQGAFHFME